MWDVECRAKILFHHQNTLKVQQYTSKFFLRDFDLSVDIDMPCNMDVNKEKNVISKVLMYHLKFLMMVY